MEKNKGFSVLKVFIAVICVLFIIISVLVNVLFADGKIPHLLGRYIYIAEDTSDVGDSVKSGAVLIAKDASNSTLSPDDIVLCYPTDSPDKIKLRSITKIKGDQYKLPDAAYNSTHDKNYDDEEFFVAKDKILAKCTGYPQSLEIGKFITFTKSIKGLLLELILPAVILVIFLIAKIASSKNDADIDNFDFYEYDGGENGEGGRRSHVRPAGAPLFEASQEIQPSDELERKKMSIAENFSQKKVNPNSPYQKEKERTMQFKAQRSAESSFAARNIGGSSSTAPTADALREEMLRKTAEVERTGTFSVRNSSESFEEPVSKVPDNTGVLSKAQLAEMSRNEIPKGTPLRSQSAAPAPAPKKSSSPDISDILKKTDTSTTRRKPASDMSVDDLLKMIENEKKKL